MEISPLIDDRVCGSCGCSDRVLAATDGTIEHFVKPEVVFIDKPDMAARLRRFLATGWKQRVFQGRQAVERMTCVSCLNENHLRDSVWREMKRDALRIEQAQKASTADNYYSAICEDW